MFAGLLVILIAGSLVELVGMSGMSWLIQSIGAVWVIAFVILFQPELRRMLIRIGQLGFLRTLFRAGGEKVISEVAKAAMELSRHRFGGLIVFQRSTGLRGVVETGVPIQAEVSADLLITIFFPRTPLHDGAVLISGVTIVAARCILPLTIGDRIDSSLGTRHRAAIGITEEVDAVALVISEETGTVSIACNGEFTGTDLDTGAIEAELNRLLYPTQRASARSGQSPAKDVTSAATGNVEGGTTN